MTKQQRDLSRLPGVASVTPTRGGHLKLTLMNGRCVFTSATPGDQRTIRNTTSTVRRVLRQGAIDE
jgi:hypothetical protein